MFTNRFGQTVSVLDLSRRKELEKEVEQRKAEIPPKGSLYDVNHVARVSAHFSKRSR